VRIRAAFALPVAVLAAALAVGGAGAMPVAEPASSGVAFDDSGKTALVLSSAAYRLTLTKRNGEIRELVDRASGARLLTGQGACLWSGRLDGPGAFAGGCAFSPGGPDRFAYAWDVRTATLTLTYAATTAGAGAVATITALPTALDLRLTLTSRLRTGVVRNVLFPADLAASANSVVAGYAPNYLPGVRLKAPFFSRAGNNVYTYPSRWAFADYLALDLDGGSLALYSRNPAPNPLAPVDVGFAHSADGFCSGVSFCLVHTFETAVGPGETWTSPVVRLQVGETPRESILDYRRANGIDAYPSVADKLGKLFAQAARSPLVKADLRKALPPFSAWAGDLARLPSPSIVHPVAFQPGGHDESDPDFLPPDPSVGSNADFRDAVAEAHRLGLLVMPYTNASWWAEGSPTLAALPPPLTLSDIAAQDALGGIRRETYGSHTGVVVSPFSTFVQKRVAQMLDEWQTDVPVDCVFLDQIGARPWLRDYNPAASSPVAYDDGWLAIVGRYHDRCLMVEDGWDRLAATFTGFHGGLLLMDREDNVPDKDYGAGNWDAYPLVDWLLHDKVLLYQHDLYEPTMTADLDTLTWNALYGFQQSYAWNGQKGTLNSPWLDVAGDFQHALGRHTAGRALDRYEELQSGVTVSAFGDLEVQANLGASPAPVDGSGIAPQGFLARAPGLVAGVFTGSFGGADLTPGLHYLLAETVGTAIEVRQPLGDDTPISVDSSATSVVAYSATGLPIGPVPVTRRGTAAVFDYRSTLGGTPVAYYRLT
jgi:hypothetical protein